MFGCVGAILILNIHVKVIFPKPCAGLHFLTLVGSLKASNQHIEINTSDLNRECTLLVVGAPKSCCIHNIYSAHSIIQICSTEMCIHYLYTHIRLHFNIIIGAFIHSKQGKSSWIIRGPFFFFWKRMGRTWLWGSRVGAIEGSRRADEAKVKNKGVGVGQSLEVPWYWPRRFFTSMAEKQKLSEKNNLLIFVWDYKTNFDYFRTIYIMVDVCCYSITVSQHLGLKPFGEF